MISCIISRYNEDLLWTLDFPFNQFKYTVYNKGINELFEKTHVINIITLPNVGRCDHTFIYHIVHNYDKLSNIQVFLPGSINMINKHKIASNLLSYIINNNKAIFRNSNTSSIFNLFKTFSLEEWTCTDIKNKSINDEAALLLCEQRPFGKWFNSHNLIDVEYYCINGIFSVDKRDILQYSVDHYEQFLKELCHHSNPEVGHYIERSWGSIFGPFKHTLLTNDKFNKNVDIITHNKWCILLINIDVNKKNIYLNVLHNYLKTTKYFIVIVENTEHGFFNDISMKYINRIKIISLNLGKNPSSNILKAQSIKHAIEYILKQDFTNVLTVNGIYFLPNIQSILCNIKDADVYIQTHKNQQHTEYYGIKSNLLSKMVENVNASTLMKVCFYRFIKNNKLTIKSFDSFDTIHINDSYKRFKMW